MLGYIPIAPAMPGPAFESSVFSWLTIPVFEATTLTLQKLVLAINALLEYRLLVGEARPF